MSIPLANTENLNVSGWDTAPIVVVCDPPPNPNDYNSGRVMADTSKHLFLTMANAAGFSGEDFAFITCCPPIPDSEKGTAGKIKKYASQYRAELREFLIRKPSTEVIVYLGSTAGQSTLEREVSITKERGQVVKKEGLSTPIMGMFSPSHVLRVPDVRELVETDFNSLAALRDAGWDEKAAFEAIDVDYRYVFDISGILANPPPMICVDTETIGFYRPGFGEAQLLTVQFSYRKGESFVLPIGVDWWNSFATNAQFIVEYTAEHGRAPGRFEHAPAWEEWQKRYPMLTEADRDRMLAQVKELLENPRVAVTGHNFKYDMHVFHSLGINVAKWAMDTMQAAFSMDENMVEKSLDECTRRWVPALAGYADRFNQTTDKSRLDLVPPSKLLPYAAGDTDAGLRLAHTLGTMIKKDIRNFATFQKIQMPTLRAFVKMESMGIGVSPEQLQRLGQTADASETALFNKLISLVPSAIRQAHIANGGAESLRFSRADFVADILFTKKGFGLKPLKWTAGSKDSPVKKPSTSAKDHLPFFLDFKVADPETPGGYPFVAKLIEYQKIQKLRSTYLGNAEELNGFWQYISPDARVRSSLFIHDTVTGRSNSRNPNMQNLPKRAKKGTDMATLVKGFRKVFKAAPGFKLIESDLSQAELRVAAVMANDPVMIQIYASDGDIHTATAAAIVNLTPEQFSQLAESERDLYRTYAKSVNFGFLYGMGSTKFGDYAKTNYEVDVTTEQAIEMRAKFFRTYPALEHWHDGMREFAKRNGYVRALHGALRHLPSINSTDKFVRSETERMAINSPVQRFASDVGLIAVSRLCRDTDWNVLRPLIFIHDAVICEVREDVAEEAKGWVKFYMENPPLEKWFGLRMPVPIRADVSIGDSLGEMEKCAGVVAAPPPWFNPSLD